MAIVDPFDTSQQEIIDPFDESTEPAVAERQIPELRAADPMTMWEKAKTIFKDPDKEGARAVQALVDSEIYGIRPSAAYKYRDALDRGEKIYPQATMLQSSMWERINQSKDIGITQNRMGEIGYDYILTGNPKSLEQMFELESGLPKPEETYISEGRLESAVRSAAKMLPMMLDTARESSMKGLTVGALFGGIAALAGQAGPQIALPEEILTIPAATAVGFKVGATEGMFEASLRKEAGLALSEIIRLEDAEGNRIDPNLARAAAFGIGTINAAIEVAQLRTLMKTVPGLNKLFSKAIAETVTDKTVLAQLSGLAKQYLGVVSTETGQEIAQESTNIVFEELSKKLSNRLAGTDIKPADADAIFNRLRETAVESARAFSVIAVPGIAMQAAGVRGTKQAAPTQTEAPATSEAQKPAEMQAPAAQPVAQAMSESDLDALIDTPEEELDAAIDAILEEEAPTRLDAFREQVANVVDEEQADAVTSLLEARAKAVNMTADEYLEYHNLQIEEGIAPEDKNALLQSAFHGTPYRFDKFTLDHIGEGEGAQAYGWGLYFAGKREVAEYYKEQLAKDAGQLYEVDIPGDDVLLDWDKPLKDQIQSVKKSIKNLILLDEQWAEYINQLPEKAKSTAEKMVFGELPVTGDKSDIHWSVLDKSAPGQDHNIIHDMRAKYGEFEKLNGGALYGLLYYRQGGAEEASKTLASMGLKGIRYLDQISRQEGEGTHNYVIFDADSVKILNTFYQKAAQTEGRVTKASVVFEDQQTIIRAFESADVSSLVHELGHVFRRDLNANDLAVAGEWAGAKEGVWDTDAEEKWARGFERYLAEGKAPTEQLRTIFEQFKQWLLEIYQAITGSDIDVSISPEVRGVFDGLLAEKPAETLYQKGPAKETVKGRIRRITGQIDLSPEVAKTTERKALREEIKAAVRAAREAKRAGLAEGVASEKARLQEMFARQTEQRKKRESVRMLRARIKKELKTSVVKKQAGKPVGKFTPEIQETLDTLRRVSKMTPEEAEARIIENLTKYENELPPPEVAIENHLLEMAARMDTINDPEILRKTLDDIIALKREGRRLSGIKAQERAEKNAEAVTKTLEELGGIPEDLRIVGMKQYTPKTRMEAAKRYLHTLGKTVVGWDDIMDILSSKSKTKPGESFISKNNNLLGIKNAEKRGTRDSMNGVHDIYSKAYGVKTGRQILQKMQDDNTRTVTLKQAPLVDEEGRLRPKDLTFTVAELRKRAMELMDPTLWPTLQRMGYTEQVAADISEALSPQDKDFIDLQMDFYGKYYDGVNEVYKEIYGVNLPRNDAYSPIAREGISKPVDAGLGEFMREMSFRASAATAGALKSRVATTATLAQISDISVLQQHIAEMEHFKAWSEKVRDLNAVWKHPDIRSAIEIHHGRDMIGMVDNFISDFAHGGSKLGTRMKGLDKFRVTFTRSALAVRPSILVKQLTSFVAFAEQMPVGKFSKYHLQFWQNPIANAKELYSASELLKARGWNIDRDLSAAMKSTNYAQFAQKQSFLNMLMLNVQVGDQGAIIIGGWPYYKWLMNEKGYTKEAALEAFEKFTEQTQQSGDITEQSYWQRGGSLAKLFTMFRSSENQYLRKEIAAIRNLIAGRQGVGQTVKTLLIYHIVLPMFFQLASDRFTWDEEEQLRAMIFGPLNGFFIMGDGLDYILRKALGMRTFDMEVPVYSVYHDFVKAMPLIDLFDLSSDEFFRAIRGLAAVTGAVTGVPLKAAVDVTKGIADVLEGEYEKGLTEMIGYSPYLAEQTAKD